MCVCTSMRESVCVSQCVCVYIHERESVYVCARIHKCMCVCTSRRERECVYVVISFSVCIFRGLPSLLHLELYNFALVVICDGNKNGYTFLCFFPLCPA